MAGVNDLKNENIRSVKACFYEGGIWTKNMLSEKTGLSLAGTTNVLQYLLSRGEIILCGKTESKAGRPSKQYILNPDYAHIGRIAACYGPWQHIFRAEICRLNGETTFSRKASDTTGDAGLILRMMKSMMDSDPLIRVFSISIPGICADGKIGTCDIASLENTDLGKMIEETLQIPTVIENDVNSACIGYSHMYPDAKNMALVYQPEMKLTGCGILIDGKLYHGYNHSAGEIKHLPLKGNKAEEALKTQISTLCAVLDPQRIGWYSDIIPPEVKKIECPELPEQLQCETERLDDFYHLITDGLYTFGMHELTNME